MHPSVVSAQEAIVPGWGGPGGGGPGGEPSLGEASHETPTLDFHYCISILFAWVNPHHVDEMIPGDDAADARWFTIDEIRTLDESGAIKLPDDGPTYDGGLGGNVLELITVARALHDAGVIKPSPLPGRTQGDDSEEHFWYFDGGEYGGGDADGSALKGGGGLRARVLRARVLRARVLRGRVPPRTAAGETNGKGGSMSGGIN